MKNCKVRKLYTILAPVLVFVTLLFSCPLFVHGATTVKKLPYDYTWNYVSAGDEIIQAMLLRASRFVDVSDPNLIVFWYEADENAWYAWQYCVAIVDGISYPSGYDYDTTDLSINSVTLTFSDCYVGFCNPNTNVWDDGNQNYAPANFGFFGTNAILVENASTGLSGYRHMPIYGTVELDDQVIIGQGEILPTPSDPSDPDPIVPDVPTPSWPDFPDDITVENLLTWIGNCIKAIGTWLSNFGAWLKIALNKIISNIMAGLKSIIDNFKSLFKPYIDKVLEFINDFSTRFKDFVSDILSLVTDIKNAIASVKKFFDHIIDLGSSNGQFSLTTLFVNLFIPSGADLQEVLEDSDTFSLISVFIITTGKIKTIYDSIINVSPVKVLHVPSLIYHGKQIGNFDIDFSWFDNYKVYTDTIISGFLILTYLWFLFFRFPSYVRGQGNILSGSVADVKQINH